LLSAGVFFCVRPPPCSLAAGRLPLPPIRLSSLPFWPSLSPIELAPNFPSHLPCWRSTARHAAWSSTTPRAAWSCLALRGGRDHLASPAGRPPLPPWARPRVQGVRRGGRAKTVASGLGRREAALARPRRTTRAVAWIALVLGHVRSNRRRERRAGRRHGGELLCVYCSSVFIG
jgi:hypothetical protein